MTDSIAQTKILVDTNWETLIWAAAKENGIPLIYTEDFQHGRDVEGVRIVNPFAES